MEDFHFARVKSKEFSINIHEYFICLEYALFCNIILFSFAKFRDLISADCFLGSVLRQLRFDAISVILEFKGLNIFVNIALASISLLSAMDISSLLVRRFLIGVEPKLPSTFLIPA